MSAENIIPWENLSNSAKYSFKYLHPEMIAKSWEAEVYEDAKNSPREFIRCQIETSWKGALVSKKKQFIDISLNITEIAIGYGLKVKNNKCICPFHRDTNPSLSLNNEKNVFYCHGCKAKGDLIEFIRRLSEWKDKTQSK